MARQIIIAGQDGNIFLNEQAQREAILPGAFADEYKVNILSPTVVENLTAADSPSEKIAFNRSVSETMNAVDTDASGLLFLVSVSESGTAADSESELLTVADSLTEIMSAATTQTKTLTYNRSVSDTSMSAADSETAQIPFAPQIMESMSAADSISQLTVLSESVSDTLSALDHESSSFPTLAVSESMSAADTVGNIFDVIVESNMHVADHPDRTLVYSKSVSETGHLLDSPTQGINLSVVETMAAVALASEDTDGALKLHVHESLSAADTNAVSFNFSVADTLTVRTFLSGGVNGTFNLSVAEHSGFSVTTQTATVKSVHAVHDSLSVADSLGVILGAPNNWHLNIQEVMNAVDASVDPETFESAGLYFWGYGWAYGKYPTLAVWCAGLDCGDHPINPDGSVFVPWGSDPDGLFTPAWLFDLNNNQPAGGFGASACNIDLTTNNGTIARVVVDLAIGLPYQSTIQLLRPNAPDLTHSQYGPSLGETRRLHQYAAQLAQAQGLSVGTTPDNLRAVTFSNARGDKYQEHELFTGVHWDLVDCEYDFDGMLMMQMFRPYPATIAAIIGFMKTMDRE